MNRINEYSSLYEPIKPSELSLPKFSTDLEQEEIDNFALENLERSKNIDLAKKLELQEKISRTNEWNLKNNYIVDNSKLSFTESLEDRERSRRISIIEVANEQDNKNRLINRQVSQKVFKSELVFLISLQ